MSHISNRFKNRLRMLGVKYVMQHTGKVTKGDLVLFANFQADCEAKPRWHKAETFRGLVGRNIAKLKHCVKRPLENAK